MSRIGKALAALNQGLQSYMATSNTMRMKERQDKEDAWREEEREQKRKEWKAKEAERQAMLRAGETVTATPIAETRPDTMDNRDVGQPGEPALPVAGYDVMGKRFASQADAEAAAAAANDPSAREDRVVDAISKTDPERGLSLRSQVMQRRVSQKAIEDREKVKDIVGTLAQGGVDAIPEIYSRYNDGMTAKVTPGQGGAFTVERTDKNGKPAGKVEFASMEDFITRAVARMNPDLYMTSQQRQAENDLKKRAVAADEKRADAAMVAATGRANSLVDRMDEADRLRYSGLLEQQKALQAEVDKALVGGMATEQSPQIVAARQRLRDMGLQIDALSNKYAANSESADPLGLRKPAAGGEAPAGTAAAGGGGGQIAAVIKDMQATGVNEAEIDIAGVKTKITLPTASKPGKNAGPKGGDKAVEPDDTGGHLKRYLKLNADAIKDAGSKAAEVAGKVKDTPVGRAASKAMDASKAASDTIVDTARKAVTKVSELGVDYTSEEGKKLLQSRVNEAKAGGKPLTEVEELRAKQAGLIKG